MDKKMIRFSDAGGNDLFRIKDAGQILLHNNDLGDSFAKCKYLDDNTFEIDGHLYQPHEFAERMERIGTIYSPKHPRKGDVLDTYAIMQIVDDPKIEYRFEPYEKAKEAINLADYRRVYSGVLAKSVTLDDVFEKHNLPSRPQPRKFRSVSVSDIIVFNRGNERNFYYVDRYGFRELPQYKTRLTKRQPEPAR